MTMLGGGQRPLEELRFGHLARILLTLLDCERKGGCSSFEEIIERSGVSRSEFFIRVKGKMVRAGLVIEGTSGRRTKTLRLTERGRRLARCLDECRDIIGF